MKSIKLCIIGIVLTSMCFSSAWAAEAPWKKVGERNGIVGYTRPTPKSSVDEMKAVGIVDAPVCAIEALLHDIPAETEWMYRSKECGLVVGPEYKNTTDSFYVYNVTGMQFPIKDRYTAGHANYSYDKATGILYMHLESVKSNYKLGDRVQTPIAIVDYILVPKGPNKTEVTYIALGDPGGNLPAFLVNLLTKNLSIQTIASIREMVKKDKYRNCKSVVTTTPH